MGHWVKRTARAYWDIPSTLSRPNAWRKCPSGILRPMFVNLWYLLALFVFCVCSSDAAYTCARERGGELGTGDADLNQNAWGVQFRLEQYINEGDLTERFGDDPNDVPPMATAPFSARQATLYQNKWAEFYSTTVEKRNSLDMELRLVPPGTYRRGGEQSSERVHQRWGGRKEWYEREHPVHRVKLTRGFFMATTPVTQQQWKKLMGTTVKEQRDKENRSMWLAGQGEDHPMYYVSWNEAVKFCEKLTERERRLGNIKQHQRYRLPTEAEWEYATRAGTDSAFHAGDEEESLERVGWYLGNSERSTRPVGRLAGNAWGLRDLHGNVNDWCLDWYGEYSQDPAVDPEGPGEGAMRVVRGGSFIGIAGYCRSAFRNRAHPDRRFNGVGFRVVLEVYFSPGSRREKGGRNDCH